MKYKHNPANSIDNELNKEYNNSKESEIDENRYRENQQNDRRRIQALFENYRGGQGIEETGGTKVSDSRGMEKNSEGQIKLALIEYANKYQKRIEDFHCIIYKTIEGVIRMHYYPMDAIFQQLIQFKDRNKKSLQEIDRIVLQSIKLPKQKQIEYLKKLEKLDKKTTALQTTVEILNQMLKEKNK